MKKQILAASLALGLAACSAVVTRPPGHSEAHLNADAAPPAGAIPPVVEQAPFVPPPEPVPDNDTFTVVVNDVPVKELLFALARDAKLNVDVHPDIKGMVTLNAIDQTLPQILDRLGRQVDLRYEINKGTLVISPDAPYYRTYKIDYVNMSRDTHKTVSVATQIQTGGSTDVTTSRSGGGAGGGSGNNNSTTTIESTSNNRFWETLYYNVMSILGQQATGTQTAGRLPTSKFVIPNAEAGIMSVLATHRQHAQVQAYIDQAIASAQRQVLIEATIVEVNLSDRYRAGVDWSRVARDAGFSLIQSTTLGTELAASAQAFLFNYSDSQTSGGALNVTVEALKEFGDTRVLSSPKVMVLNNQTALLKVVNNEVYFTINVDTTSTQGVIDRTFESTVHTVPVGFVMSVTPGIHDDDTVILNVRPTISRIDRFVNDPNPALAQANVTSPIPVVETRELESVLRVVSGQIAALGGLMQDDYRVNTAGVPVLSKLPGIGEVFKNRDNNFAKSELVIFMRPTVVRTPSVEADQKSLRPFLHQAQGLDLAE
ncbi:MAG: pilus (MSHA type) biogenesis protein MshL [Gammaproteobacteria bacterium]